MPDPFFSQPKQRKRKRDVSFAATGRPAKAARSTALGKSHKANGVSAGPSKGKKKVDEELSDSADAAARRMPRRHLQRSGSGSRGSTSRAWRRRHERMQETTTRRN
jgi:hypothetical protein